MFTRHKANTTFRHTFILYTAMMMLEPANIITLCMRIVSWNIKGLRSPSKRINVLRQLQHLKTDIALLQENIPVPQRLLLPSKTIGRRGSAATRRKAGVIILLHKSLA